ncbi:MAG: glycine cleavage system aminomethyltransferase GcvT [Oscillospiraceae bacterium]|nr:glycine cleavage system aminomethyltransferase GcvT [Oscillospiraceae bacterium]
MEKKTPLYDTHVKYGGKIVPFGGFLLPVQYSSVIEEHKAVREKAGLFDVSHMGEITLKGPDSLKFLNHLLTNDYTSLKPGSARYSPMANENGGTVDDLIVYMRGENDYFIVVNAANKDKDYQWMLDHVSGDCELKDVSDSYAQIALQGPLAYSIMLKLVPEECLPQKNYTAIFDVDIKGICSIISRTGYTGEDGFEIYYPAEKAAELWELVMDAGKEFGLIPCGLGARDTLRLEAAMPLYGHELTDELSPVEACLTRFVKLDKDEFIGKEAIIARGEPKEIRVGLQVTGRGIVREHMDIYADGRKIGHTTSGTMCPYVGKAVAMAMVEKEYSELGTKVTVDVRGRSVECEVVKLPFYKRQK